MKKVIWLSRHEMSSAQKADLEQRLDDSIEVETRNLTWVATTDENADRAANKATWLKLTKSDAVICGVFPPVAIEALQGWPRGSINILSPVSKQGQRLGDGPIPFIHVRWASII